MFQCSIDGCENTATHRYAWAWGEAGLCCEQHRAELEQSAVRVNRAIRFSSANEPDVPEAPVEVSPSTAVALELLKEAHKVALEQLDAHKQIIDQQTQTIARLRTRLNLPNDEPGATLPPTESTDPAPSRRARLGR